MSRILPYLIVPCIALGVAAPLVGAPPLPKTGQLISPAEWRRMGYYSSVSEDLIALNTGSKLQGELIELPLISYPFGSMTFEPKDVAMISFAELDGVRKIQVITRDGRHYIGPLGAGQVSVRERLSNNRRQSRYVERQLDPQSVHLIMVAPRPKEQADSLGRFYHLALKNGDKVSVQLERQELQLTDGWRERSLLSHKLVEATFNGGLQGTIDDGVGEKELGFAFVKDPYLRLRFPSCEDCIQMPWEQINHLKLDRGDFSSLFDEQAQTRFDQFETSIAPSDFYADAEDLYSSWEPSIVLRPEETAAFQDEMMWVPGGQFYVSVSEEFSDNAPSNLFPTANKPSFVVQIPSFYADRHEVTNAEYLAFVQETGWRPPSHWSGGHVPEGLEDAPVVNVTFQDATAYAKWAGKRLPTEVEWQRASEEASTLFATEVERRRETLADPAFSILSLISGFETVFASEDAATTTFSYRVDGRGNHVAEWTASPAVATAHSPEAQVAGLYYQDVSKYGQHRIVRRGFLPDLGEVDYRATLHQAVANETTGFRCVADRW